TQGPHGMTFPGHPAGSRRPELMPDQNLHWIRGLRDYYLYSGDAETAAKLFPAVLRSLDWWSAYLAEDDLLHNVPGRFFADEAGRVRAGVSAALNALYVGALGDAADLADRLGQPEQADDYRVQASRTAATLNDQLWDPQRRVYVDALVDGTRLDPVSQLTNGLMLFNRLPPPDRWGYMVDHVMESSRLKLRRPYVRREFAQKFDEREQVALAHPIGWYFLFTGLDRVGLLPLAVEEIGDRWGWFLKEGATAFPESWDLTGDVCRAGSAAPTYVLSASVLGVQPMEPGFTRFRVAPQPVGLSRAEGVFPSPAGDIRVAWESRRRGFDLTVTVPEGTVAEAAVPSAVASDLEIGGKVVWFKESPRDKYPGLLRVYRSGGWLVCALKPGSYTISRRP
ncbi:alpha-L-rhamnosidase C-terminal domain-containing protein, partial [candidate division KSB1 bacterium]